MKRSNIEDFFKQNEKRPKTLVNTETLAAVDTEEQQNVSKKDEDAGICETIQAGDTDVLGPPIEASQETQTDFNVSDLSKLPLDPPS